MSRSRHKLIPCQLVNGFPPRYSSTLCLVDGRFTELLSVAPTQPSSSQDALCPDTGIGGNNRALALGKQLPLTATSSRLPAKTRRSMSPSNRQSIDWSTSPEPEVSGASMPAVSLPSLCAVTLRNKPISTPGEKRFVKDVLRARSFIATLVQRYHCALLVLLHQKAGLAQMFQFVEGRRVLLQMVWR